jgi:hypothetical protein
MWHPAAKQRPLLRFLRWFPLYAFLILVCIASICVSTAHAASDNSGVGGRFQKGENVTVPAGQTVDHDLYVLAKTVEIDGTVNGDVFAIAGSVTVDGTINGNLFTVSILTHVGGTVTGSLRTGSAVVSIDGNVQKDALAYTLLLNLPPNAQVGGALIFSAPIARLRGTVKGGISNSVNSVRGDRTGPTAYAGHDAGSQTLERLAATATVGDSGSDAGAMAGTFGRNYLIIVAIGVLLLWLFRGTSWAATEVATEQPLHSIGAGLLTVGAAICLVIVVGILTALLILASFGGGLGSILAAIAIVIAAIGAGIFLTVMASLVLYIAYALVSLTLGRLVGLAGHRLSRTDASGDVAHGSGIAQSVANTLAHPFVALLVGAVAIALFSLLPGAIGGLYDLVVVLLGLGAFALATRHRVSAAQLPQPVGAYAEVTTVEATPTLPPSPPPVAMPAAPAENSADSALVGQAQNDTP